MSKSTPPSSLRNIPPDALKLAHALSAQMGLSLSDIFRLALVSGLLVEATRVAPDSDGNIAGWEGPRLAKALRRHLGSAIDLLIENGEHPYNVVPTNEKRGPHHSSPGGQWGLLPKDAKDQSQENALEDDLEDLGIGFSLSAGLEDNR